MRVPGRSFQPAILRKAFRKRCYAYTEPYDWSQLNSFGTKSGSTVLRTVREPVNAITDRIVIAVQSMVGVI
jgi:hypothetical protein